ncbi:type I-F CRISPR-associated helicase Cas3f [Massilia sp. W12]|uniref:type I-F CRISPR-associated helicase Cas3f n=1 Tax=Massilia sp. W12 TaxID=3126507 RepID=UPI0030D1213E
MNVLLISECSKNALQQSRRILDQFAERKGERTWQTLITQDGLDVLRKLLRQSARRNTAVACWWIKQGAHAELLWIVGNRAAFNDNGAAPTHQSKRDILRAADENQWRSLESIACLAAIAGLFHDFGKANQLFQAKLKTAAHTVEPLRHEWVSLLLFAAFVDGRDDRAWLQALAQVAAADDARVKQVLDAMAPAPKKSKDGRELSDPRAVNPFRLYLKTPLARCVGWLIVSHHRLLHDYPCKENKSKAVIANANQWLEERFMNAHWNSPQYADSSAAERCKVWKFEHGTPLLSQTWRSKAQLLAARALRHGQLFGPDWLQDSFSAHLARLSLMLADHSYSSQGALPARQDPAYQVWANTERSSGALKQRLDEHNLSVGWLAQQIAGMLPAVRASLPALSRHPGFKKRVQDARFKWQDMAFDLAQSMAQASVKQGFFGVNMASTGCGKTFANARILYALADQKQGCRFSIALGLRTLTLQTGDALRNRLRLQDDDLAVLIGSAAVRQLHELGAQHDAAEASGSASAQALLDEDSYVRYEGALDQGRLGRLLAHDPNLRRLLSAPILVSTIDYLMPATEGERGGRQIGPMLRLLSGDLIVDEPDDFDLSDMPALARLIHWAGMLGTRIVLSSATLPPALVQALFEAYAAGRALFHAARGDEGAMPPVLCAWFDEFGRHSAACAKQDEMVQAHAVFVAQRSANLQQKSALLRRGAWLPMPTGILSEKEAVAAMARSMQAGVLRLHAAHASPTPDGRQQVSFGLLRFANIRQLVAVAQNMLSSAWPDDTQVRFCIYHSRHPLAVRSAMEGVLDQALSRHQPEQVWQCPSVRAALAGAHARQVIFMVFATPVAEVGRDHDYDWSVVEPSSLRSIIQLAGRVQRHRQIPPQAPNVLVLSHNFNALTGKQIAYAKPGVENGALALADKDLQANIPPEHIDIISALPRIQESAKLKPKRSLADLEHAQLRARLLGSEAPTEWYGALWWRCPVQWAYELQSHTPFRAGQAEQEYVFYMEQEDDKPLLHAVEKDGRLSIQDESMLLIDEITLAPGVAPWMKWDLKDLLIKLAQDLDISLEQASRRFGVIALHENVKDYRYAEGFGVYRRVE